MNNNRSLSLSYLVTTYTNSFRDNSLTKALFIPLIKGSYNSNNRGLYNKVTSLSLYYKPLI